MNPLCLTKPLCSNDGKRTPFILLSDKGPGGYPIVGYFEGVKHGGFYDIYGRWEADSDDKPTIINTPTKRKIKFWVNVYPNLVITHHNVSRQQSDSCAGVERIACLEFEREFEEGEGLK